LFMFTAKLFKLPSRSLILSRLSSVLATSFDACSESCPLVESETVVPPFAPRDAAGPAELPAPCVTRDVGRTNSIYRNICIEVSLCVLVYPIHGNLCAAGVTLWAWLPTTCARRMDASSCRPRAHAHAPRCSTEASLALREPRACVYNSTHGGSAGVWPVRMLGAQAVRGG
jgi:hypothetical protein